MKINLCNMTTEGRVSDVCYRCKAVTFLVRILFVLVLFHTSTAINAKVVVGFIGGTVGSVDLDIYLPPVMDSGGLDVLIDDSSEEVDGGVVFVNLDNDNDDGDNEFDINDTDGVSGEDDLAKLELNLKPYSLFLTGYFDSGLITLNVVSGEKDIKIYTDREKKTVYTPGELIPISDFIAGGLVSATVTLYIEGIRPQINQQQTKFEMKFKNDADTFTDEVSLTVIGVESVIWEGKGNSLTDTDELDPDPGINRIAPLVPFSAEDPPRAFNPVRVFPGKRMTAVGVLEARPRNKVNVKVSLTVPPPQDISVFLRVFDMDDPTEDQLPTDDDSLSGDNRGAVGFLFLQTGAFIDPATLVLSDRYEMKFKASKIKLDEKVEFEVTMQPGDNFAVVANGDKKFLEQLENDDDVKAAPGVFPDVFTSTQAELDDNLRITDSMMISLFDSENEVIDSERYVSQILTVWRYLHIEVDSMGEVVNNRLTGAITNVVEGIVDGTSTVTTDITFNELAGIIRFESGVLINGGNRFGVIRNSNGENMTVDVINNDLIIPQIGDFILLDDDDYNGDDLVLDGDIAENIDVPDINMVEDSDDYDCTDGSCNMFAHAYIRPIYDIGDDNNAVEFLLNIPDGDEAAKLRGSYDFDQISSEDDPDFWTVYLLGSYQMQTEEDCDGLDFESLTSLCTAGQVDDINGLGASVFLEAAREFSVTGPGDEPPGTTAHEIAHLFNASHGDEGVMSSVGATVSFSQKTLFRMRTISHP